MKTKSVVLIYSLFTALCGMAGTVALSSIGELSPVGAEVSTNLVLSINRERFHGLCVTFAFEATATNGVEIAVVRMRMVTDGFPSGRVIGLSALIADAGSELMRKRSRRRMPSRRLPEGWCATFESPPSGSLRTGTFCA